MTLADSINGDGVRLRRYRLDDTADLIAACNDPLTLRFLPFMPDPYTDADALSWITQDAGSSFASGGGNYAITDPATDKLIGGVGIGDVRGGAGEIGYWVAPWARGRGVARAANTALADHALGEGGVGRLILRTEFENTSSQRVAIASGFTRECVQRGGGTNRAGGRDDLILWARLAGDLGEPIARLLPDLPGYGEGSLGELRDDVVVLRPLVAADSADTFALRALPDVIGTSVPPRAPDAAYIDRSCARSQALWLAGERADFTVRDARTDRYAGEIGFYYFEPPTQQAMIGYSIHPEFRGMGYAKRAAQLVADWAFEHVGVARVVAGTAPDNIGSQRVLERAAFVREGYQRARLPGPDGTRIDDILYARINPAIVAAAPPGQAASAMTP